MRFEFKSAIIQGDTVVITGLGTRGEIGLSMPLKEALAMVVGLHEVLDAAVNENREDRVADVG